LARAFLILAGSLTLVILLPVLILVIPPLLPVDLPKPTGFWSVLGRTRAELDDPEHKSDGKKILLWIWYPAATSSAGATRSAPYLPQPWRRFHDNGIDSHLFAHQSWSVHTNSMTDAPLAGGNERFPILLMMPGLGASVLGYQIYAEELASHGYVVVGIAAPNSEPITALADGKVYFGEFGGASDTQVDDWARDIIFVLDHIDKITPLIPAARLDLDKVGAFGHSFGGAAAIEACALDSRFKAAADLDGKLWGSARKSGADGACMIVHGQPLIANRIAGEQLFNGKSDKYLVTISGSTHFNYSDNGLLLSPLLKVRLLGVQILGDLDGKEILLMNRSLLASFFDRSLKNLPAPYLESNKLKEMQIQHFKPGENGLNLPSF